MQDVYLVGLCRTAVGSFGGAFKSVSAVTLGETVMREAVKRSGLPAEAVEEIVFGNVLQANLGQNPARQAAVKAGLPVESPAVTINKVCGSGLHSVTLAYRAIRSGEAQCVMAGGMENMSQAPYLLPSARWGARMNNMEMVDSMIHEGLWDAFHDIHMGITAENVAEKYGITRQMQDEIALRSQQRAAAARAAGKFVEEIVPVAVPQRKGDPIVVDQDEHIRENTTMEALSKLRPAFKKDGTVTAGNASGINDGAAAMLVVSGEWLKKYGVKPMLRVVATGSRGVDPQIMGVGPAPSVKQALERAGLTTADIDLFALNEAFAAQAGAVNKLLELSPDNVNVNGGAIAIGHPIGASGARLLVSLGHEMKRRQSKYGVASLCIGGGMGEAVVVEYCK